MFFIKSFQFVSYILLALVLVGCSGNNGSQNLFSGEKSDQPVQLFGQKQTVATETGLQQSPVILVKLDEADLSKAIKRYQINTGIAGGTLKTVGVDLNGDGQGEAVVFFEGDQWCISTGCQMVVFSKGPNGYRRISDVKRVKLPVSVLASSSEGWRDLAVRSGNTGIGQWLVPLRFKGNYPKNATTVAERLDQLPPGSQTLLAK